MVVVILFYFSNFVWKQASCEDNPTGGWKKAERDWSPETYGRKCETECSSWQEGGPTFGHERTVQGNGLEFF